MYPELRLGGRRGSVVVSVCSNHTPKEGEAMSAQALRGQWNIA